MFTSSVFGRFYHVAADLFRRFPPEPPDVSFTHIPVGASSTEFYRQLCQSPAAPLLLADRTFASPPRVGDDGQLVPVLAGKPLHHAAVRVSYWGPPAWDFRAASLDIRLIYGADRWVAEELNLYASESAKPRLTRVVFQARHAETGYEGEPQLTIEPTGDDVEAWSDLVLAVVARPDS